jgi:transglutaminase-like putative cysteine protease
MMRALSPLSALTSLRWQMANLARDKADTLLLLAACLLVMLPHASHLSLAVILCSSTLLGWRAVLTLTGRRLPPARLLLPIAMAGMALVWLEQRTLFGREAGVAMLMLLLACKLLEMHAKRDLFVVVFLSLFVILTNFLYSQSIGTALMMVVAILTLLSAQLSFQYTGKVPPLAARIKLAGLIFGLAVPLALVLFVLFPRISGPLWGLPNDAHSGKSGLSGKMAPGNISHLAQSEEIALRAKFDGATPPKDDLYWRGPVLSNYDGRNWSAVKSRNGGAITISSQSAPIGYQVTLEANGQPWLYALELARDTPVIDQHQVLFSPELEMTTNGRVNERLRYHMRSVLRFQWQAQQVPERSMLQLPPNFNPRSLALARSLQARHPDPWQLTLAVLNMFRQQPFRYTLEPPALGEHAMDEFLFQTRAGFCEHYASAFVVLMRGAGVPSRVVTGYQGGEINPVDGFMVLRQSDAHAWAEIWIANRGWIRIDPTAAVAPERVEKNLASALKRSQSLLPGLLNLPEGEFSFVTRWRNNWSALNNSWNQWVLDYTPGKQRELLQNIGLKQTDWQTLAFLAIGVGIGVMTLAVLPLLWQRRARDPQLALYLRLCQILAKRGLARAPHEGPTAYRARLMQQWSGSERRDGSTPATHEAVLRFLEVYSNARYGPRPVSLATLKSLFTQCQ